MQHVTSKPVFDTPNKGWKRLDSGVFKSAYLPPDKSCVVVCAYEMPAADLAWYDYAKRSTNPHIVKVLGGPLVVKHRGKNLTMVRCELLSPTKGRLSRLLDDINYVFCGGFQIDATTVVKTMRAVSRGVSLGNVRGERLLASLLSTEPGLYKALYLSAQAAPSYALIDISADNVMMRGTVPVLIDPWVNV